MSINAYRSSLRSIVRGYWSGALSLDQFNDQMVGAINRRLSEAWDEGAAECGIRPDEYTVEEFRALGNAIHAELGHIPPFARDIGQNSKINGGKLGPHLAWVNLWVNRYRDMKNMAKTMACKDAKLIWIYGDTQHCSTCLALHGKVKRASYWRERVQPQQPPNSKLECGGWRCQCTLQPTDKPLSKGPLPLFKRAQVLA